MIRKEQLYEQILEQIDLTKETDDEELQELIRTVLDEAADEEYISLSDKIRIGRELFNPFRKLDVLQEDVYKRQVYPLSSCRWTRKLWFSGR